MTQRSSQQFREGFERSRGAVLLLALMAMTASVLFGLFYVNLATTQLQTQALGLERLQARSVAEGGLEMALRALRGHLGGGDSGDITLGEGSYRYQISAANGGYEITATGSVRGIDCVYTAFVSSTAQVLKLTDTISVRGAVSGEVGPGFHWSGTLRHKGNLSLHGASGKINTGDFDNLQVDDSHFNPTLPAVPLLLPGVYNGRIESVGNVTVAGQLNVTGALLVNGHLTLDGLGVAPLILASDGSPGVLFVRGDLILRNYPTVTIQGSVFVEGKVSLENIGSLRWQGSLLTNNDLDFDLSENQTGLWDYDPAILANPPAEITGGPRMNVVTEAWRRWSYTPANPSNDGN